MGIHLHICEYSNLQNSLMTLDIREHTYVLSFQQIIQVYNLLVQFHNEGQKNYNNFPMYYFNKQSHIFFMSAEKTKSLLLCLDKQERMIYSLFGLHIENQGTNIHIKR